MIPDAEYKIIIEQMPVVCIDAIIINHKKQFLLVRRKNEPLKGEYWVPGGRLLKNETLQEAIIRKVRQELGIESHIIMPLGVYEEFFDKGPLNIKTGFHAISMVYLMIAEGENIQLDDQSDDWGWFDKLPERFKKTLKINTLDGLLG